MTPLGRALLRLLPLVCALSACGEDQVAIDSPEAGATESSGATTDASSETTDNPGADDSTSTTAGPGGEEGSDSGSGDPGEETSGSDPGEEDSGSAGGQCGNGIPEAGEACDLGASNGEEGVTDCKDDCSLTTCGDGYLGGINGSEECDGEKLRGLTCMTLDGFLGQDYNYVGGVLGCRAADDNAPCTLDLSRCDACGNGVLDADEECDDGEENGNEALSSCKADCRLTTCGDGYLGGPGQEECEGEVPVGQTCELLDGNFVGGTLACVPEGESMACTFDLSSCETCGNGRLDEGEECDGIVVPEECATLAAGSSFTAGQLSCGSDCTFDTSACTTCGNDLIEAGEECDGVLLGGQTCESLGGSGTLLCNPETCQFDVRGCGNCDGVAIDGAEECDGSNLGGQSCTDIDNPIAPGTTFATGTLVCGVGASACSLDTSDCSTCGDGARTGSEECDRNTGQDGFASGGFTCVYSASEQPCSYCDATTCEIGAGTARWCGDGFANGPESCDEGVSNGVAGVSDCRSDCTLTTCGDGFRGVSEECDDENRVDGDGCDGDCVVEECGDGRVNNGEACDSGLPAPSCDSLPGKGFTAGGTACTDCVLDTSACTTCGDGSIEGDEQCEGANLGGETCLSQGKDSGTLGCTGSCTFAFGGCGQCGDDAVNGGEECDGGDLAGAACTDIANPARPGETFASGSLSCGAPMTGGACLLDTSACFTCGDGVVNGSEECDDGNTDKLDTCANDCTLTGGRICDGEGALAEFEYEPFCGEKPDLKVPEGMVCVPSGVFEMGSADVPTLTSLGPVRQVCMPNFYIDRTEVTVTEYRACVDASVCVEPAFNDSDGIEYTYPAPTVGAPTVFDGELPVNGVSWEEAREFCSWKGKRLPSEAEWEKAARGFDARIYPWGSSPAPSCDRTVMYVENEVVVGDGCGSGRPVAVGSRAAGVSPYGALDMTGNLSEWVSDWYQPGSYDAIETINPQGPATGDGDRKMYRGGPDAWTARDDDEPGQRTYWRNSQVRTGASSRVGFRCAASVSGNIDIIPQ